MKAETPEVASEGHEISVQVHRVLPHQSRHQGETQTPQNLHLIVRLIWDEIEFEWQVEDILMIIVILGSRITNLTAVWHLHDVI